MRNVDVTIDQPLPLFTAVIICGVSLIIFNALPVIMGVASDDVGLTAEQLGLMASVELGGIGLASVSGLFWIRRLPWRPTVFIGTLVLAGGDLLSASASGATELIALRFLTGLLGEGVIFTVAFAAIGDAQKTDRAFAYYAIGQVGLGMVALWGFPYIALERGFAGVMGVMAVLPLLCLVLLPWLPAGGEKGERPGRVHQAMAPGTGKSTPFIGMLGLTCWFVGLSGIWAFVERIGVEILMTQTAVGTLLALGMGTGALASLLVALFGHRLSRFWPPVTAIALHAAMCLAFAGELSVFGYGTIALLFTFVWNFGLPYLLGLIADCDVSGRLVVLLVSGQAFGNTLGPLLAGQVVESSGLAAVGVSSAILCILALAIVAIFTYRVRATIPPREPAP